MGDGTGLGLASVHGTVTQAGGRVVVESTLGQGSTFRVFLPAAPEDAPSPTAAPEAPAAPVAGGTETVLLCEDEAPLRELLERMLGRAATGSPPPSTRRTHSSFASGLAGAYDMPATDVVMPGGPASTSRRAAARRVRLLRLISGFNAETVDAARAGLGGAFLREALRVGRPAGDRVVALDGAGAGQASSA